MIVGRPVILLLVPASMGPVIGSVAIAPRAGAIRGARADDAPTEPSRHHQSDEKREDRPTPPERFPMDHQGEFLFALFVIAFPPAEISCPAPAVVWQAPSNGMALVNASKIRAATRDLCMDSILSTKSNSTDRVARRHASRKIFLLLQIILHDLRRVHDSLSAMIYHGPASV